MNIYTKGKLHESRCIQKKFDVYQSELIIAISFFVMIREKLKKALFIEDIFEFFNCAISLKKK